MKLSLKCDSGLNMNSGCCVDGNRTQTVVSKLILANSVCFISVMIFR